MKLRLLVAAALLAPLAASAAVEVAYTDPMEFRDLRLSWMRTQSDAKNLADQLAKHLQAAAEKRIPEANRLRVTLTDVDMAGEFRPELVRSRDLRVVQDLYPPRLELEFTYTGPDGREIAGGKRSLRDPMFLQRSYRSTDLLIYEKNMLDDWLDREFKAPKSATANANR